jgi:hypothetical protein
LLKIILSGLVLFCFFGCKDNQDKHSSKGSSINEGYALLYHLMKKEGDADKVFIIKSGAESTKDLLKDISGTAQKMSAQMKSWASHDPSLTFENEGLPSVEKQTRESIESERTGKILKASGADLDKLLLTCQYEALTYGVNLTKTLSEKEESKARKETLSQFVVDLSKLQQRVFKQMGSPAR